MIQNSNHTTCSVATHLNYSKADQSVNCRRDSCHSDDMAMWLAFNNLRSLSPSGSGTIDPLQPSEHVLTYTSMCIFYHAVTNYYRLMSFHGLPFVWFIAQFIKYLMRPSNELREYLRQKKSTLGMGKDLHPIVG